MIIGICGKSGSGKSTLGRQLLELIPNAVYLDMDKVGHQVLLIPEVKRKIIDTFGTSVLTEKEIDRKKIGNIVFNSEQSLEKYNQIIWIYMESLIDEFLKQNKNRTIVLDAIKLNQTKYFDMCDIKLLLDIPYEIRKERVMKRDNITAERFDLREQASVDYDEKEFDFVLRTNENDDVKRLVRV